MLLSHAAPGGVASLSHMQAMVLEYPPRVLPGQQKQPPDINKGESTCLLGYLASLCCFPCQSFQNRNKTDTATQNRSGGPSFLSAWRLQGQTSQPRLPVPVQLANLQGRILDLAFNPAVILPYSDCEGVRSGQRAPSPSMVSTTTSANEATHRKCIHRCYLRTDLCTVSSRKTASNRVPSVRSKPALNTSGLWASHQEKAAHRSHAVIQHSDWPCTGESRHDKNGPALLL